MWVCASSRLEVCLCFSSLRTDGLVCMFLKSRKFQVHITNTNPPPSFHKLAEIGGDYISVKSAGNLSTLFDVGGIVGGILAGYISDKLNARAITAASFMYAAIPSMLAYRMYGSISRTVNIVLMMIAGLFVNGPYALITTAVSADLGTHRSLRGDSRALATVTAIIDGTGSAGAALGPLLTGFISSKGWDVVFLMLMVGALTAGLLLSRLVVAEISEKTGKQIESSNGQQGIGDCLHNLWTDRFPQAVLGTCQVPS